MPTFFYSVSMWNQKRKRSKKYSLTTRLWRFSTCSLNTITKTSRKKKLLRPLSFFVSRQSVHQTCIRASGKTALQNVRGIQVFLRKVGKTSAASRPTHLKSIGISRGWVGLWVRREAIPRCSVHIPSFLPVLSLPGGYQRVEAAVWSLSE